MKKFKAMFAATAAVMALSAVSVPMSAFAQDIEPGTQVYEFDGNSNPVDHWTPDNGEYELRQKLADEQDGPSTQIQVDFSIEPTYTVTIPADVHFSDTVNDGRTARGQVKVEDVFLKPGSSVVVTVASRNNYNMLLNGTNSEYNIPYTLKKEVTTGEETPVLENLPQIPSGDSEKTVGIVAQVPTGNQAQKGAQTVNLVYAINNNYSVPVAGSYSDILTFTIAVGYQN